MTPEDRFIQLARFDAAHAKRVWDGSAATDDAPAWYGRVATLIRAAGAPTTDDELAGESDIVARMQAAILEPATDDELAGESDIVARMQATILGLGAEADDEADDDVDGDAGDPDRPRHLRPAVPWAARRRQGVRVVRRIVAVKAAAVTTVVAIGVTAAAATTGIVATVVVPALSHNEPKHFEHETTPDAGSGSWSEGSGDAGQRDGGGAANGVPVAMDPDEPLKCMLDLDCLLHEVEAAAGIAPTVPATPAPGAAAADGAPPGGAVVSPSPAPAEPAPAEPTTTTTEPPTTTTTEPPTTTTTSTSTTSTTEPPPPDPPQPPEVAAPLSAQPGDTGSSAGSTDARIADLPADSGTGGGAGTGTEPVG
jgi:hypothetical protein